MVKIKDSTQENSSVTIGVGSWEQSILGKDILTNTCD